MATINTAGTEPLFYVSDWGLTNEDCIKIAEKEITFDLPDINVVNGQLVVMLEEKISHVRAESAAEVTKIKGQIQNMLSLEHQS